MMRKAVVLDLVQPQAAGRQRVSFGGEARRNEAGRKSTRTGKHDAGINRQRWLGWKALRQAVCWRAAMRAVAEAASAASGAAASVALGVARGNPFNSLDHLVGD